jgi:hypothetical protein
MEEKGGTPTEEEGRTPMEDEEKLIKNTILINIKRR